MKVNELKALLEGERDIENLSAVNDLLDKALSADSEEAADSTSEEVEETTEDEESTEESTEETTEETEEESAEAEETPEEATEETHTGLDLAAVSGLIETLSNRVNELEAELAETKKQLSAKAEDEKIFVEKFKKLSATIREDKTPEVKTHHVGMTNGIGEL